jgi:hypothetical protein
MSCLRVLYYLSTVGLSKIFLSRRWYVALLALLRRTAEEGIRQHLRWISPVMMRISQTREIEID